MKSPLSRSSVHRHLNRTLVIVLAAILILLVVAAILLWRVVRMEHRENDRDAAEIQAVFDTLNANPQPELTTEELNDIFLELNAETATTSEKEINDVFIQLGN